MQAGWLELLHHKNRNEASDFAQKLTHDTTPTVGQDAKVLPFHQLGTTMIHPDRQSYLITRALAIAIELLSVLPEDSRPDSDISDLKLIYGQQNDGGLAAHNQAQARKYINMLRGTAPTVI